MKKFVFLFFISFFNFYFAQDFQGIANKICDSIKTLKAEDSISLYVKQSEAIVYIYSNEMLKNQSDYVNIENVQNFNNISFYKVNREVKKKCSDKLILNEYIFFPITNVVDFDNVFSFEEFKNLKSKIFDIRKKYDIDILVLEIDDFYPFKEITDYSFNILENWNNGSSPKKGKIIIVFSKNLRQLRISTDLSARTYLSDSKAEDILNNVIIPNFKEEKFYNGILQSLTMIAESLEK